MYKKKNGVYYTPSILAKYLAEPLILKNEQTILDPAYGEGSLLLAAESIFNEKNIGTKIHLYGCDTQPVNGLLKHLPEANLVKTDFFDYPVEMKFETILMNPPFVRHHIQNERKISKYRALHKELEILNNSSDLWALFMVKAVSHLKVNGNLGAILPWAFLQADYSKPLRKWLSDKFGRIDVVALSNKYFQDADERVVILWLKHYGQKNCSLSIAVSNNIKSSIGYSNITLKDWLADRVSYNAGNVPEDVLTRFQSEYGFTKFSDHATVKIGVVTGAVDHFILSKLEAKNSGITRNRLVPIITKSEEFPKYIIEGKKNLRLLVALKEKDHLKFKKFIHLGKSLKYNLRAHSIRRDPWYAVNVGKTPDAFFHYRTSMIPYLLPNHEGVQCTNTFHRIYFNTLTPTERKWIYVSMLSSPAQLAIEINSKTYGRGILKIEPKSLKNAIVIKRNDIAINRTYNTVLKLLSQNRKEDAVVFATKFLCKELKISKDLIKITNDLIESIRKFRRPE